MGKMAEICNLSAHTVILKWMKRHKIPRRTLSECHLGDKNHNWIGGKRGYHARLALEAWESCWNQRLPRGLLIHHFDRDWKNHDPTNIVNATRGAHNKIHGRRMNR